MKQETTGWQWRHMQIICTSLQTDNHTTTQSPNFLQAGHCLTPNQQRQSIVEWVAICRQQKFCSFKWSPNQEKKPFASSQQ